MQPDRMRHAPSIALLCTLSIVLTGCPERKPVYGFLPMQRAVEHVESNRARLPTGIRAYGQAYGFFADPNGVRRNFDLSLKLLLSPPTHYRLTLEHILGGDELKAVLNDELWWVWVRRPRPQETQGRVGSDDRLVAGDIPLQPEQFAECVGLNAISLDHVAQRVTEDRQQLLFIRRSKNHPKIEKEIWLDRAWPNMIRRVVFRDEQGRETFVSDLDDYRPVGTRGAMLPRRIDVQWPGKGATMHFRIDRWLADESISKDHRAFVTPDQRNRAR